MNRTWRWQMTQQTNTDRRTGLRPHDRSGTMIRHANSVSAQAICTLTHTVKEPTSGGILVSAIGGPPLLPTCPLLTFVAAIALAAITSTADPKRSPAARGTALSKSKHRLYPAISERHHSDTTSQYINMSDGRYGPYGADDNSSFPSSSGSVQKTTVSNHR